MAGVVVVSRRRTSLVDLERVSGKTGKLRVTVGNCCHL